jgi:hypothetical protein
LEYLSFTVKALQDTHLNAGGHKVSDQLQVGGGLLFSSNSGGGAPSPAFALDDRLDAKLVRTRILAILPISTSRLWCDDHHASTGSMVGIGGRDANHAKERVQIRPSSPYATYKYYSTSHPEHCGNDFTLKRTDRRTGFCILVNF